MNFLSASNYRAVTQQSYRLVSLQRRIRRRLAGLGIVEKRPDSQGKKTRRMIGIKAYPLAAGIRPRDFLDEVRCKSRTRCYVSGMPAARPA